MLEAVKHSSSRGGLGRTTLSSMGYQGAGQRRNDGCPSSRGILSVRAAIAAPSLVMRTSPLPLLNQDDVPWSSSAVVGRLGANDFSAVDLIDEL